MAAAPAAAVTAAVAATAVLAQQQPQQQQQTALGSVCVWGRSRRGLSLLSLPWRTRCCSGPTSRISALSALSLTPFMLTGALHQDYPPRGCSCAAVPGCTLIWCSQSLRCLSHCSHHTLTPPATLMENSLLGISSNGRSSRALKHHLAVPLRCCVMWCCARQAA